MKVKISGKHCAICFMFCAFVFSFTESAFAQKIYWTTYTADSPVLNRVHPDGSNYKAKALTAKSFPQGIAFSTAANTVFWGEAVYENAGIITTASAMNGAISTPVTGQSAVRGVAYDESTAKIYWISSKANENKIYCSNADGSGVEVVYNFGAGSCNLRGIAVDGVNGNLYYTDYGTGLIGKISLSSRTVTQTRGDADIQTGGPSGIAVDPASGKVYWTEINANRIKVSDLNFATNSVLYSTGCDRPQYIAFDALRKKLIWTEAGNIYQRVRIADVSLTGALENVSVVYTSANPGGIAVGTNIAPVVSAITKSALEDAAKITVTSADLNAAYTDADGDNYIKIKITGLPSGGTLKYNSSAVTLNQIIPLSGFAGLEYYPNADYHGSTGFTYQASDGSDYSADAAVNITVTPVADNIAVTGSATDEDVQTTSGLVVTRNAADGAEVSHFKVTGVTNGKLYLNDGITEVVSGSFVPFGTGTVSLKFTPANDFNGTASFTVQASTSSADAGLGGQSATAEIVVAADNDLPTLDAISNSDIIYADSPESIITLSGITAGGGESQTLTIAAVSDNTALIANPDIVYTSPANTAMLKFTPAAGKTGKAVITVTISDNGSPVRSVQRNFTIEVKKIPGNALVFDGSDDRVEIPYSAALNTPVFTVEFWAKVSGADGVPRGVVTSRVFDGSACNGYGFYADQSNKWQFYVGDGSASWTSVSSASTVSNNTWTHIAGTFDGTALKLYVNGKLSGSTDVAGTYKPNTSNVLRIGSSGDTFESPAYYMNGAVDEVRIWNKVRTAQEISDNMTVPQLPASEGLSAYYRFDQFTGSQLKDICQGANNGTLLNAGPESWVSSYAMVVPSASAATDLGETSFTAHWSAPAFGTAPVSYLLEVDDNADFSSPVAGYNKLNVGNVTSYNVTGLESGKVYHYRVSAAGDAGQGVGASSNEIILDKLLPVELAVFTAEAAGNDADIKWQTASEISNYGFDIERRSSGSEWKSIGFVKGNGTSNSTHDYSFRDKNPGQGKFGYRLKQIDNDGKITIYPAVEVELQNVPEDFVVYQNYPNPFNPSTKIRYGLPFSGSVRITLFNVLGEKVTELLNTVKDAGFYEVAWNASDMPSGIYFYSVNAASSDGKQNFSTIRKMQLVK
ncbi:MAG: LamG-like jellyroll fold domain-containing protein [Bacteroidota bacterium]